LQDIVDRPGASEGLVRAGGVEGEGAWELTVLGDDADVRTGHEQADLAVLVHDTDGNVSESAEVADSYLRSWPGGCWTLMPRSRRPVPTHGCWASVT
jgi:hypothetical protein